MLLVHTHFPLLRVLKEVFHQGKIVYMPPSIDPIVYGIHRVCCFVDVEIRKDKIKWDAQDKSYYNVYKKREN